MPAPLLLVDVDGVVSLFGFDLQAPPDGTWTLVDGLPHLISAQAAAHLERLDRTFECAWCTGWKDRTERLDGLLGVDLGWPYVPIDTPPGDGVHWKLGAIERFAGDERPLAWIDDRFDASCDRWAAERRGPTLLVATDPAVGITAGHVDELLSWAPG